MYPFTEVASLVAPPFVTLRDYSEGSKGQCSTLTRQPKILKKYAEILLPERGVRKTFFRKRLTFRSGEGPWK